MQLDRPATGSSPGSPPFSETRTARYGRSADVDTSTVGDRVVLYHRVTGSALVLNPTATWLWQLLTTSRDRTARLWDARTGQPLGGPLHHAIRQTYPAVSQDQAGTDVRALIDELLRHQVITTDP